MISRVVAAWPPTLFTREQTIRLRGLYDRAMASEPSESKVRAALRDLSRRLSAHLTGHNVNAIAAKTFGLTGQLNAPYPKASRADG